MQRVLIVAAHPDDEVLGCFGTVARLIDEGSEVYTLILGEGKTSRDGASSSEIVKLKDEIKKANEVIGVKEVFTKEFADNRFDSVSLLDIVKAIEEIKSQIKPDTIFTHYQKDLNIDHQKTYQAVITATRPMQGESVKEIYSFDILSSTEWNYPISFSPDFYVDINGYLDKKIEAMKCYNSELRDYPHPRSLKGIELSAKYWGMRVGLEYAEAFEMVRRVY